MSIHALHAATALDSFKEHGQVLAQTQQLIPKLVQAAQLIADAVLPGGQLLVAGNGGSAADALHIAGELLGRFMRERRPLAAIALNANDAALTAIANDYGYEHVFARQVAAHGKAGDVFLAISTSGNSANIVHAARMARTMNVGVIGLTGQDGGELRALCDVCLDVPSTSTPRIQEMHSLIGHALSQMIENCL